MSDAHSRIATPPALAWSKERDVAVRVVTLDLPQPGYTCSVCASAWPYQEVRNTGRCPSCGSGLLRDADWP